MKNRFFQKKYESRQHVGRSRNIFFANWLVVLSLTSCSKFLEVAAPIDKQTSEQVFNSDETAQGATIGMYMRAIGTIADYYLTGLTEQVTTMLADEVIPRVYDDATTSYIANNLRADLRGTDLLWRSPYQLIYHCNAIIDQLTQSPAVSGPLKKRLLAEVKFFRAFHYFYLVNFYGEVPLAVTPDYRVNGSLPKSKAADVYAVIVSDLEAAYEGLQNEYFATEKIRANKWAACALLARTHLYLQNWDRAAAYAQALIDSRQYRLVGVDSVVLNSNDEAIFQVSYSNNSIIMTGIGSSFLYQSATTNRPDYYVRQQLVDAFTLEDRRQSWLRKQTATDGEEFYMAYKYKVYRGVANEKKKEHLTLFRLGEQYLILAEALAQQGQLAEAIKSIDVIRARAGIPLLQDAAAAYTKEQVLDSVMAERQRELCFEFGQRWLDLNRTGRAGAVLSKIPEKDWQPTDRYFPIPQSEILLNPFLKQNPGYE